MAGSVRVSSFQVEAETNACWVGMMVVLVQVGDLMGKALYSAENKVFVFAI